MPKEDPKKKIAAPAPAAKGAVPVAAPKGAAPAAKGAVPTPALKGGKGAPVPEAAPAEKVKVKKEKKPQKERPHSKKKHKKVQVWKLYSIKDGKVHRKNDNCPRCGMGTFLAAYKNRKYCGKCGWGQVSK